MTTLNYKHFCTALTLLLSVIALPLFAANPITPDSSRVFEIEEVIVTAQGNDATPPPSALCFALWRKGTITAPRAERQGSG